MDTLKMIFVFLILPVYIFACTSTTEIKKPLPMGFEEPILSKGIQDRGTTAIPSNPTTTFSPQDPEAIAYVKLTNLSGKHKLRWNWYDPNGYLYYSTGNYPVEPTKGKFLREVGAWHRLSIRDEKAARYPGNWQVKLYLDNELLASKGFRIELGEINVDELPMATISPNPKNWGFIIGIENYASLPTVDYASKDALIIKEYFMKILGVPEENIISLYDSSATKARLEGYLKSYIPKNVEKDTTLFVYFAGHGAPDIKSGDAYLIAHDSDPRFIAESSYKLESFYKDLNNLQIKRAFVFLDACFSGAAARGKKMLLAGTRPALIHVEDIRLFSDKVISLTAATGGQISNSYPEKAHGLFTYFLLRGLRGEADTNDDSFINVGELYSYVNKNVTRVSRRKGIEQTPVVIPSFDTVDTVKSVKISEVLK